MGLRDLIKNQVEAAIVTIDDLADAVVYSSTTVGDYNISTGTNEKTTVSRTFNAVLARFSADEMDDSIVVATDMKMIVAANDFGTGEPNINDTLTAQGKTWNVENSKGVPGQSVWLVHIRKA